MMRLRGAVRLRIPGRRDRPSAGRFLEKARFFASCGQWAVAAASVAGLQSLSDQAYRGAMESMRLYLESFLEDGEFFERTGRNAFGLMLRCGDEAAFERRLEILRQDSRYLYMAAYPGKDIRARVSACRVADAPGVSEAFRLVRARNAAADRD